MKNKTLVNTKIVLMVALIAVVLAAVVSGCSSDTGTGESQDSDSPTVSRGEHELDDGESGDGVGEESGTELTLNETYDMVRKGARLILVFDQQSNSFVGTVENTTSSTLQQVRVEVHLSNGIELGPTTPVDLAAGEKVYVILPATDKAFDGWTTHAEVGSGIGGEHSSSDEGGGEHGNGGEGGGEHGNGG